MTCFFTCDFHSPTRPRCVTRWGRSPSIPKGRRRRDTKTVLYAREFRAVSKEDQDRPRGKPPEASPKTQWPIY